MKRGALAMTIAVVVSMATAAPAAAEFGVLDTWGSMGSADGQFNLPEGIAIGPTGEIWVADTSNDRIQKFDAQGNHLATFGGNGVQGGKFDGPTGIATDSLGNVYVSESENNRIQKLGPTGTFAWAYGLDVTTPIGGTNPEVCTVVANCLADETHGNDAGEFHIPADIAIGPAGEIFVADEGNDRVQEIGPAPSMPSVLAGSGTGAGDVANPRGLAVRDDGIVYAAEYANFRIGSLNSFLTPHSAGVSAAAPVSRSAATSLEAARSAPAATDSGSSRRRGTLPSIRPGTSGPPTPATTGSRSSAQLAIRCSRSGAECSTLRVGIAADAAGNIYVVDRSHHRIVKLGELPPAPPGPTPATGTPAAAFAAGPTGQQAAALEKCGKKKRKARKKCRKRASKLPL